jgi:drug/metabolite transporter (DMT)-like permease
MIVASRLLLGTIIVTPFVLRNYWSEIRNLSRHDLFFALLAGLFMVSDSTMFVEAIDHTTILVAGVIGGTTSIWTALLERFLLKGRINRHLWIGVMLSVVGGTFIALGDTGGSVSIGANPLLGAVLALGASVMFAFYMITGRSLRKRLPMVVYTWLVFVSATVASWVTVLVMDVPVTGYNNEAYLAIVGALIGSMLIAHPGFNYALGFFSATMMTLSAQLVTVMGAVMAFFLFDQLPGMMQIFGSVIMLVGVTWAGQKRKA